MAINLDINSSSVFAARDAVRSLEKEYESLNNQVKNLNDIKKEEGNISIAQQKEMEELKNQMSSLNKEMNTYYETIDNLDTNNLTASFEDMYGAVKPLSTQIGELEDRLYQMKMAGEENSEEFLIISERVGIMKASIKEVDNQIDILAANKGILDVRQQFGALGTSIANLDFKSASMAVEGMTKKLKGMDINKFGNDMKSFGGVLKGGLTQGVKTASAAFKAMGMSLLANPIMLIVAVIAAIGVAMYLLKDKIAIFQKAFELLTIPLQLVMALFEKLIDYINDFTDLLGLTNVKEQKIAKEKADRYAKEAEDVENVNDVKSVYMNNELRRLQANGVNTKEEIDQETKLKENILLLEKEKVIAKIKAAKTAIDLLASKKKLSDDEKQELEDQKNELNVLRATIDTIDTDIALNKKTGNEKKQKIEDNAAKERLDKQKIANDKERAAQEKHQAKMLKLRQDALNYLNKIDQYYLDTKYDNEENQYDKDYKLLRDKLELEKAAVLSNTQLTEEEIQKINDYFDKLNKANEKKRDKAEEDARNEKLDRTLDVIKQTNDLIDENELKALEKKLKNIKDDNEAEVKLLKDIEIKKYNILKKSNKDKKDLEILNAKSKEEINEINNKYRIIEEEAEQEHQDTINDITKEGIEKQKKIRQDAFKDSIKQIKDGFDFVNSEYTAGYASIANNVLDGITEFKDILDNENMSIQDKALAMAQAGLAMVSNILAGISEQLNIELQSNLDNLNNSTDESMTRLEESLKNGTITQEQYNRQKYDLELKQFKKSDELQRKAFEENKKIKIAQASISMAEGMVAAYMGAQSIPLVGPVIGAVLAAAVGSMGAINIAKIKATNYKSGTAPTMEGGVGNVSIPDIPTNDNGPISSGMSSEHKQNSGTDGNNNSNNNQTIVVESKISVVEIEDVTKKVNNYSTSGEL